MVCPESTDLKVTPFKACEPADEFRGQRAKRRDRLRGQAEQEALGGHLSGALSSRAQGAGGWPAPTGRGGVRSRAGRSPPRAGEERGELGSGARNCPVTAKIAPQMGSSCAPTGLNWKHSSPLF